MYVTYVGALRSLEEVRWTCRRGRAASNRFVGGCGRTQGRSTVEEKDQGRYICGGGRVIRWLYITKTRATLLRVSLLVVGRGVGEYSYVITSQGHPACNTLSSSPVHIYIYWYKLVPTVIWPTQGCHSTCSSLLSNELPYISFRAFSHPRHHPPIFSILASVTTTALYLSPSHSVSLRPFSCPHSVSLRHSSCAPYYQINATASPFPLLYRSFSIYLPIIIRASSLQRSYFFPYFSYSSFYRRHHCFGMIYIFFI